MVQVGVHEAKTTLSRLLRQVEEGEVVVITRDGEPVARLVPEGPASTEKRALGLDRGKVELSDDFNEPLPPDLQQYFE